MNNKVFIFDTTLRDGEKVPGCQLNTIEKIEVALALEALGVDVLEAGFPVSSPGDFKSVVEITKNIFNPTILKKINNIKIYDPSNRFVLTMGKFKIKNHYRPYVHLDLFVNDGINRNFIPINVSTLNTNINNVLKLFEDSCGMVISTKDAHFKSLEINFNIKLDYSYLEYYNVLAYLFKLPPKKFYRKRHLYEENSTSFKVHSNSCSLQFYNKSLQLKKVHKIKVTPNVLRIEYCLKKEKLKDISNIKNINISEKDIKNIFFYLFRKDIISPHTRKLDELRKELLKIGKILIKENYWIKDLIIEYQHLMKDNRFILDEKIIFDIMKILQKNNYHKNYKAFMSQVKKSDFENNKMLNEIIRKISASEANQ